MSEESLAALIGAWQLREFQHHFMSDNEVRELARQILAQWQGEARATLAHHRPSVVPSANRNPSGVQCGCGFWIRNEGETDLLGEHEKHVAEALTPTNAAAPELYEALRPFAHPDLCELLGGNAEGDASIIYARNNAVLTLGDFRRARAVLAKLNG